MPPEFGLKGNGMGETTQVVNELVEEAFGQDEAEDAAEETPPGMDTDGTGGHRRLHKRRTVDLSVIFKVILEDGKIFNRGTAKVKNISSAGALMEDIELASDALPVSPFKISMKILEGLYEGVEALCEPIRFIFRPKLGLGLRFEMLSVQV